jgi:hypothetical protein
MDAVSFLYRGPDGAAYLLTEVNGRDRFCLIALEENPRRVLWRGTWSEWLHAKGGLARDLRTALDAPERLPGESVVRPEGLFRKE